MRTRQFSREIQNVCWYKLLRPAQRSYLFLSWKRLRIQFDGNFVLKFESLIGSLFYQFPVPTAQHPIQQSKLAVKIFYLTILWALRKWKSSILSEQALKGNGDKLVKEFLSTLECATYWLDIP